MCECFAARANQGEALQQKNAGVPHGQRKFTDLSRHIKKMVTYFGKEVSDKRRVALGKKTGCKKTHELLMGNQGIKEPSQANVIVPITEDPASLPTGTFARIFLVDNKDEFIEKNRAWFEVMNVSYSQQV